VTAGVEPPLPLPAAGAGPRAGGLALRRFLAHPGAVAGLALLVLVAAAALGAPWIQAALGLDPEAVDLLNRFAPPSAEHPLGTDELGRDLLARLLDGGRVSLAVGVAAAVAAGTIGTAVGLLAGFLGGRVDAVLMRLTDGVIALPLLPLAVVLAAVDATKLGVPPALAGAEGASVLRLVAVAALFGWTTTARLVRAGALAAREQDYVRAAVALGASPARLMLVHVLPNVASPVVVATTLSVGNLILLESVLSFLGLGIQPPLASWGNMLTNAQELVWSAPRLAVLPGLMIFATVVACNFVGDGLRDALDPRAARRG
jgi:peptide/nickel transport system permease protein